MAKRATPDERAAAVDKALKKAKKTYRLKTKVDRKDVSPDEIIVITDMLISLRVVGYSPSLCAKIVGLSKGQVREICNDPNFKSRLASIKTKLPEAAINLGRAYLVEAVQSVVHVMRTETDNALVLKAAAELFDRFGIPKLSRSEIKTESDETSGDGGEILPLTFIEKLRGAPPEIQEKVAELSEMFSEGVEKILSEGIENASTES